MACKIACVINGRPHTAWALNLTVQMKHNTHYVPVDGTNQSELSRILCIMLWYKSRLLVHKYRLLVYTCSLLVYTSRLRLASISFTFPCGLVAVSMIDNVCQGESLHWRKCKRNTGQGRTLLMLMVSLV